MSESIEVYWDAEDGTSANWCVRYGIELGEDHNWQTDYDERMNLAYGTALAQAMSDPEVIALLRDHPQSRFEVQHKHCGDMWTVRVNPVV
jgi:hypothetical protein